MKAIRVPLKPSHRDPIMDLYVAIQVVQYEIIIARSGGPSTQELATLKARAMDFLALPLIQGLNEDGL